MIEIREIRFAFAFDIFLFFFRSFLGGGGGRPPQKKKKEKKKGKEEKRGYARYRFPACIYLCGVLGLPAVNMGTWGFLKRGGCWLGF